MGVKLSDSASFKLEPVRKNLWVFQFTSIPGNGDEEAGALAFAAHTCTAPSLTFEKQSIGRMNESFNYAGKHSWSDITCSFYDFIRNSSGADLGNNGGSSKQTIGQTLYNWASLIYNPSTGQRGYKTQYATSAALAQLDPAGNIIRSWNLYGIFPISINWGGSLSYDDFGFAEVECQFAYDIAVKGSDATHSTESA